MSSSLFWRPLVKGGHRLDPTTKAALHKLYGEPIPAHKELGPDQINSLLVATHFVEEPAKRQLHELIDAIRGHGAVELSEEW